MRYRPLDHATLGPSGPTVDEPAGIHILLPAPDGETMLAGRYDRMIQLRDLRTGRPTSRALAHPDLAPDR